MKNLVLGALLIGLGAACGGGSSPPKLLDAGVGLDAASPVTCDPIAQTGCSAAEKCTWIIDVDADPTAGTDPVGHAGCAAVGTTPLGGACDDATATANGGADHCVAGSLCISQKCKAICDVQLASGTAKGSCDIDHACAAYSGVFISGNNATAGVCEPGCDPLTQRLLVGGAEQCGATSVTQPDVACTPASGFTSFLCAPSGADVYARTERDAALTDSLGNAYSNGCSPGYVALFPKDLDAGANTVICSGLCAPQKVDSVLAGPDNPDNINEGDKTALGKLLTDTAPVAGHATCGADSKGSATDAEDCVYLWEVLASFSNVAPSEALRTPYSDTVGVCFAFGSYLVAPDATQPTMLVPFQSCATLPPPEMVTAADTFGSAADNGCYSLTETLAHPDAAAARSAVRRAPRFRGAYGPAQLARHVFD
jgi:hypothetical protein